MKEVVWSYSAAAIRKTGDGCIEAVSCPGILFRGEGIDPLPENVDDVIEFVKDACHKLFPKGDDFVRHSVSLIHVDTLTTYSFDC